MNRTVSLATLRSHGIVPKPHEAVAIVLALLEKPAASVANGDDPTLALPLPSTIALGIDGTVSCRGARMPETPFEIAKLLQLVLERTPGIPPGLLYSIARALRAVEAPPFESSSAFLRTLARFERGSRQEVVAGLVARMDESSTAGSRAVIVERRRTPSVVTYLRQELRAVDRRRYEAGEAQMNESPSASAPAETASAAPAVPAKPPSHTRASVLALCGAAALVGVGAMRTLKAPVAHADTPSRLESRNLVLPQPVALPRPPVPVRFASRARPAVSPPAFQPVAAQTVRKPSRLRIVFRFKWTRYLIAFRNDL